MIEWNNIRTADGSQHDGFEELCCQLAECEHPEATFFRKGKPDAGIECWAMLPSGEMWGWQAKYYTATSQFGNGQWGDLDKSVKTAILKHSDLTHYVVCIPFDQPDARIPKQNSFADKWSERVTKWQKWAKADGRSITFEFWGSYQLRERLTRSEHRGRMLYWFDVQWLSQAWQLERYEEARASAGARYTPEIHVDLPIAQVFDGLGRTPAYFSRLKSQFKKFESIRDKRIRELVPDQIAQWKSVAKSLMETMDDAQFSTIDHIPLDELYEQAKELSESTEAIRKALPQKTKEDESELDYARNSLFSCVSSLRELIDFVSENSSELVNRPCLLLVGDAGQGKTHLFCDIAKTRIEANQPTVLLMGQRLTSTEDPWTQFSQQLGLNGLSLDDFLGALDAAAHTTQSKAMILIDALNEGMGKQIWKHHLAAFVKRCSRYPRIALAVSIRTNYESFVIPDEMKEEFVRVVHYGFARHEYEATVTFFEHYGIELPSTPLLAPEFRNPLFLKILCKGLEGEGKVPRGVQGITSVFQLFIEKVNHRIWEDHYQDFSNKPRSLVQNAIGALVEAMASEQRDWLRFDEAEAIIDGTLSGRYQEIPLYTLLVSEGVLNEDVTWVREDDKQVEVSRFAYERFSDHLIVKHFIDKYADMQSCDDLFGEGQPLAFLLGNYGWRNALRIQIPERFGRELDMVVPHLLEQHSSGSGFINSIIWRNPKSATDETFDLLNHYLQADNAYDFDDEMLEAMLTVSINPDHFLNADYLHHHLMGFSMAERDAYWSVFLHYHYENRDAVDRLIDWAWSSADKSHISDESIRLCAVSLTWFLTTSNRFVRDKATKALINILTPRLYIIPSLLEQFKEVNDLYVLERLLAVAYGCVMRSAINDANDEEIGRIAQYIYDWLFSEGNPPAHILLRDYASGVVKYALHRGANININQDNIDPPFATDWPEIPTEEEINAFKLEDGSYHSTDGSWAHNSIIDSTMSHMEDFARYIVTESDNRSWLSLPLDSPKWASQAILREKFLEDLTEQQEILRDSYEYARHTFGSAFRQYASSLPDELLHELLSEDDENMSEDTSNNAEDTDADNKNELEQINQLVIECENEFLESLDDRQRIAYGQLFGSDRDERPTFDLSQLQRWIVQRVFELGWSKELFGSFDRYNVGHSYREARKAERVGKKYQWIALHEIIAHLADNFQYSEEYSNDNISEYKGAWQIDRQDIDSSSILSKTMYGGGWQPSSLSWWFQAQYTDWQDGLSNVKWLQLTDDLPHVPELIEVVDPDGRTWLMLDGYFIWRHDSSEDKDDNPATRRRIWYILDCHLFSADEQEEVYRWATHDNLRTTRLPEIRETYEVFIGEFYWSEAYRNYKRPYNSGEHHDPKIPIGLLPTCEGYLAESGSYNYDCSIDAEQSIYIKMPAEIFVEKMNLNWNGVEGHFYDQSGELIICDPSVFDEGPSVLLICKDAFLDFLSQNNLKPLWTIRGEKQKIGGGNKWEGRLEIKSAFRLENGQIVGSLESTFEG